MQCSEEFNELVGNVMDFDVHGTTYWIMVNKGRKKTSFYREELRQMIVNFVPRLKGGDMLHFSMEGEQP